ncbi:diacylglycerol/lipid kinase family protein [Microbacterium gorillae]|uniref:diacylglycerol/lipid kinase family protein n=1 Tax=Microbacterium gorillae TaxID=1231063 RepID=UPI00058D9A00|nr:diacylglycerol kinase family protein [Microbacterium gorillae]
MTTAAVIFNPTKVRRESLEKAFASAEEATLHWFETSADDPGQGIAQEALGVKPDVVIVAGGAGAVRAVAEALAQTEDAPHLAIVPQGTGNLLARNLGIPLGLTAAAKRALGGRATPVDLGWVEVTTEGEVQRHAFAVLVGFGIDANMIAETDDDLKAKAGWLAYVESLGRAVSKSDVLEVDVTLDGDGFTTGAHTVLVGNCGSVQGGLTLMPDAVADDGKLDVLVLGADDLSGWFSTVKTMVWDHGLRKLLPGSADTVPATDPVTADAHYRQTEHVHVSLPEPRPFQIDGEEAGHVSEFTATVQPAAVHVRI